MANNRKRVLVLTPTYFPQHGGAEVMIHELYSRLSKHFDIDLVVPNLGGKKKEVVDGFTVHRVGREEKSKLKKFINYQKYLFSKADELCQKNNYDLIHTHYLFPTAFVALKLRKKYDVPVMTTEHHYGTGMDITSASQNPFMVNRAIKYQARRVDYIVSTGPTQDEFLSSLDVGNFETIPLGGDVTISKKSESKIRADFNLPKGKTILFSVSRLVLRKRYDIIVEAVKVLSVVRHDFLVVVGGKGPELENLREGVKLQGLENYIQFVGYVSDDEVAQFRKISSAFLSASEFEGVGIIYLEAFASKRILFAKKNGASSHIVEDGVDGFLFETADGLAELLNEFLDGTFNVTSITEKAFKKYKEVYNWDSHAQSYKRLYDDIFRGRK